jgi:hypothetical protein
VPEEPLQPLEFLGDLHGRVASEALGHLPHDGQTHGDVEPVDQVLGLGVQVGDHGRRKANRDRGMHAIDEGGPSVQLGQQVDVGSFLATLVELLRVPCRRRPIRLRARTYELAPSAIAPTIT